MVKRASKKEEGQFITIERKKGKEIIQEGKKKVAIPPYVGDEKKKALEQTGEDATSGW